MPKGARSIKVSWYMRTHITTFFLASYERTSEVRSTEVTSSFVDC
jgi:hypothetical protein